MNGSFIFHLQEIKTLLSRAKNEFQDLQFHLQSDLAQLGMFTNVIIGRNNTFKIDMLGCIIVWHQHSDRYGPNSTNKSHCELDFRSFMLKHCARSYGHSSNTLQDTWPSVTC